MKYCNRVLSSALAAIAFAGVAQANLPVSFNLAVDPTGVALQFDVTSDSPLDAIGFPLFNGSSDHDVQSAVIESGAHRFVVYSKTGAPIASSGTVSITFSDGLEAADGAISLENVTASDASGQVVTASPNAFPVLAQDFLPHQSLELGDTLSLESIAFDLDGSLKSLQLLTGSTELDAAAASPFPLDWTPATSGIFPLTLVAVDNADLEKTFDIGAFQAYNESEITDYDSFGSIHFGDTSNAAFDSDPLDSGIANGLAYLLGLNPHKPEVLRLPRVKVERDESSAALVVSFIRDSSATGVDWSLRSSSDLQSFEAAVPSDVSDTDNQDGSHSVELRLPLDAESPATFVDLEVKQSS
ncbi:hypothetical protein [Pelagicoccus sp. SDUM812005]|uniref:hypothetical protein n=1 Tax=Pelagicoccus sp. SDUM812005 TaxID=3041257 RepID=UPI00280F8268|nr:hypothetical protein [Pelagicoccus sp. SDUM812005]MDQ8180228.1 hypothetical protein [Pelagicoccus sp. SDUM812005]